MAAAVDMRMGRGAGLGDLEGLRLQEDRRDLKLLDRGQQAAGNQSGQAGREHDAPEHQAGFRSVAGKCRCVPGVVGGVVNGIAVGQCHAEQDDRAEQRGGQRRQQVLRIRDGLQAGSRVRRIHHALLFDRAEGQHATSEDGVKARGALFWKSPASPARNADSTEIRPVSGLAIEPVTRFARLPLRGQRRNCELRVRRAPTSRFIRGASRSFPWTPDSGAGVWNIRPMLSTRTNGGAQGDRRAHRRRMAGSATGGRAVWAVAEARLAPEACRREPGRIAGGFHSVIPLLSQPNILDIQSARPCGEMGRS